MIVVTIPEQAEYPVNPASVLGGKAQLGVATNAAEIVVGFDNLYFGAVEIVVAVLAPPLNPADKIDIDTAQ